MIKERAVELVVALRSGKYTQGRNALRIADSYCCLGVACDISGLGKWGTVCSETNWVYYELPNEIASLVLPASVQKYFGFRDNTGKWAGKPLSWGDGRSEADALTTLNDRGWSFAQIADFIEQNWERL